MIEFLQRLLATSSLSGAEGEAVALCAGKMRELGFDVELDAYGSALGLLGDGPGRILFDAHADTVAANPGWTRDPLEPSFEDGKLFGLGATDMKGPIAALLHGVADAAAAGELRATIGVSITTLEEVIEGAALTPVVERFRPDAVVIAEPSAGRLALGQKGRAEVLVDVAGRAAHAAFPEQGASALLGAASVLLGLEERSVPHDEELGRGILVATEAVTAPFPGISVVPSRCRMRFDRRLLPGETEDDALDELEPFLALAARAGAQASATIADGEVRTYTGAALPARRFLPAWRTDPATPFPRRAAAVLPTGPPAAFCTNGSATAPRGITTLIFGPGDPSRAHQADEYMLLTELEAGRSGFAALAALDPAGDGL